MPCAPALAAAAGLSLSAAFRRCHVVLFPLRDGESHAVALLCPLRHRGFAQSILVRGQTTREKQAAAAAEITWALCNV